MGLFGGGVLGRRDAHTVRWRGGGGPVDLALRPEAHRDEDDERAPGARDPRLLRPAARAPPTSRHPRPSDTRLQSGATHAGRGPASLALRQSASPARVTHAPSKWCRARVLWQSTEANRGKGRVRAGVGGRSEAGLGPVGVDDARVGRPRRGTLLGHVAVDAAILDVEQPGRVARPVALLRGPDVLEHAAHGVRPEPLPHLSLALHSSLRDLVDREHRGGVVLEQLQDQPVPPEGSLFQP